MDNKSQFSTAQVIKSTIFDKRGDDYTDDCSSPFTDCSSTDLSSSGMLFTEGFQESLFNNRSSLSSSNMYKTKNE